MSKPQCNSEGYKDPTAGKALQQVSREEKEADKRFKSMFLVIQCVCRSMGFEIVGEVVFQNQETGKRYKRVSH